MSISDGGFTGVSTGLPQTDLVVLAGIRLNWVMQGTKLFPQAKVVRIDIAQHEIDRNRPTDVGLVGDCKQVLGELTQKVNKNDHSQWLNTLKNAYKAFMTTELEKRTTPSDPIHPLRLVDRIMEVFGTDAFYVADGGDTCYWGLAGFQSSHPSGVQITAGSLFGCLGTGIPFALAAKLAHPDTQIFSRPGTRTRSFQPRKTQRMTQTRFSLNLRICTPNAFGLQHSTNFSPHIRAEERPAPAEFGFIGTEDGQILWQGATLPRAPLGSPSYEDNLSAESIVNRFLPSAAPIA